MRATYHLSLTPRQPTVHTRYTPVTPAFHLGLSHYYCNDSSTLAPPPSASASSLPVYQHADHLITTANWKRPLMTVYVESRNLGTRGVVL